MIRVILIVTVAAIGALVPVAAAGPGGEDITVNQVGGVYRVGARFAVPQSPAAVLQVLTDYEQIPRFMPDVRSSVVRERDGCRVIVEQEAVARMMMFSKRIHLRLEVHEKSDHVQFVDQAGSSFQHYRGTWRVGADGEASVVSYELTAKPAFSVPEFLLTRLLRRDARAMIERLQAEIAARPAATLPR